MANYGSKVPEELYDQIRSLLDTSRVVGNIFNHNISEFGRSAIRFQIIAYYLRDEIDKKLEPIYFEQKIHSNSIKIQKIVVDEIENLFYELPEIRKKYRSSKNKFIKYALFYHLMYWLEILDQLEKDKSS